MEYSDSGAVKISEKVIATIAATTIAEINGIHLASYKQMKKSNVDRKRDLKKISVFFDKNGSMVININVLASYGVKIFDVAKKVQIAVANAVRSITGLNALKVNVNITGINFHVDAV